MSELGGFIVGGFVCCAGLIVWLLSADLLACLRYQRCPKCGYRGKQNTYDTVTDDAKAETPGGAMSQIEIRIDRLEVITNKELYHDDVFYSWRNDLMRRIIAAANDAGLRGERVVSMESHQDYQQDAQIVRLLTETPRDA